MADIIRGTTPTFIYKPTKYDVSDVVSVYITLTSDDLKIEKDITEASIGEDYFAWTLTQTESLKLGETVKAMINFKLEDGTRGATKRKSYVVIDNDKEEEI